jgi:sulfur-oxidizing protein SoxA
MNSGGITRLLLFAALACGSAAPHADPAPAPRSGYDDAAPDIRAMQDDDTANPAFLWVQQGEQLWSTPAGPARKSCADCHGDVTSMRGVAARAPAYDPRLHRPVTVADRVAQCRAVHQGLPLPGPDDDAVLALSALVGLQSRGMPVQPDASGPAASFLARGNKLFHLRQGQLNLSCASCHDEHAGRILGGAVIPQGHPNGYPIYRLQWQGMGSLSRRIGECTAGVHAAPIVGDDLAALALYLAVRARGLRIETPAVRP